ncbi:MAG: alpha/beta hydrolase [Sciscionella sp.]
MAVTATTTASAQAAPASGMVAAADRAVTFVVDHTATYGTLHIPAHHRGQRLAAALLLPGSGPTDRNGDQGTAFAPHTLALIAGVLGDQGIMSLRFDKYFSGRTGAGAYAGDPGRIDLAAFIRQAEAAYHLLATQPDVNPRALLIVGHSEGGLTEMLVDETVTPHPAGLALLEPQDLRLLDLVRIQLDEQLDTAQAAGQISPATAAENKSGITRVIAEFRSRDPINTTGLLPSIAALFTKSLFSTANARYVRSDDAVYPPAVGSRLPRYTRVLVTCGTADTNVPCRTTLPLLLGLAHARTGGPGLRVLPGVDHLLHRAGTPTNTRTLAPAAVTALHAFTRPWTNHDLGNRSLPEP